MKEFGYTSIMQVPKLTKITINQGVGAATGDKKLVDIAQQELTTITGQKAMLTYSRKDISNFKLRKDISEFSIEKKRKILIDIINRYEDCDLREEILCLACEFGTCKIS